MSAVVALDGLLASRRLWRGQPAAQAAPDAIPTGWDALDAVLPGGGWPSGALSEILLPADGVGELRLVWPALARLSQDEGIVAVVAPPYRALCPGLAGRGPAPGRGADHRCHAARCVVGRRTMPARGRMQCGVVLAAESGRSRVAPVAGRRGNRAARRASHSVPRTRR